MIELSPDELRFSELCELAKLTLKQERIARLLLQGCSNADIAQHVGCNIKNVKWHLGNVYRKFDVNNGREFFARFFVLRRG